MADTVRLKSALQTLLADNGIGAISAQDLRDFLESIMPVHPLGGVLVASSTAPSRVQAQADYVCDGTADEVQINQAISDASSIGGEVVLTPGTYTVAASIAIADPKIRLRGAGQRATTITLANSANTRPIYVADSSALTGIVLQGFTIDGNKTNQTDGADPNARAGIFVDGLAGGSVTDILFRDLYITNCRGMGIACDGQSGAHVVRPRFDNVTAIANGQSGAGYDADGIHVSFADDVDFVQVNSQFNTDTGVALDHVSGAVHHGTLCRGNVSNQLTAARGSDNVKFLGCTADGFSSTGAFGIRTGKFGEGSAGLSTYVKILDCHIIGCATTGIHIEDHSVMLIRGTTFSSNGANVAQAGTVAFLVNGGKNVGWSGDTGGTATVPNGSTSVAVTHNLGVTLTPALKNIIVTPTNNLGNASKFWISSPTSTQFTINVNVDPGATTATFVWEARMDV